MTMTMTMVMESESSIYGGLVAVAAFLIVLLWQAQRRKRFFFAPSPSTSVLVSDSINSNSRTSKFVTNADLKFLMKIFDEKQNESDKWEDVIEKRKHNLCYKAKCCKPKNGPVRYLSVTIFNDISTEMLRNFYMDNDYRKQWDPTVVEHNQLQAYKSEGVEVGRTVKKFPLLRPREYVLSWKLWEGQDKTFYCFMKEESCRKSNNQVRRIFLGHEIRDHNVEDTGVCMLYYPLECEHPLAPRQRKYVRVEFFRSGWRIREVPGRNACEIMVLHQEDAGLNVEMAKLAFSKGIWNYVCKMDNALRRYLVISSHLSNSVATSVNLMQKVPASLDPITSNRSPTHSITHHDQVVDESQVRLISRRSSGKLLASGLLLLGGAICLSRGHSSLGAKVAAAYILTKLSKRGAKSNQCKQS